MAASVSPAPCLTAAVRVSQMSLQVLAYNLKRAIRILGTRPLIKAMTA